MFYLWQDKREIKKGTLMCYITNYLEKDKDGKVLIDGYGYLDVKLVYHSQSKSALLEYAQTYFLIEPKQ